MEAHKGIVCATYPEFTNESQHNYYAAETLDANAGIRRIPHLHPIKPKRLHSCLAGLILFRQVSTGGLLILLKTLGSFDFGFFLDCDYASRS
jgi:hypothetical protein